MRAPDLEAKISDAPDDPAGYGVYADWLIEHGDPLGEFVALDLREGAGEKRRFAEALRHFPSDPLRAGALMPRWKFGFVERLEVRAMDPERPIELRSYLPALLGAPVCAFIRELSIDAAAFRLYPSQAVQIVADCKLPSTLKTVHLGWHPHGTFVPDLPRVDVTISTFRGAFLEQARHYPGECSLAFGENLYLDRTRSYSVGRANSCDLVVGGAEMPRQQFRLEVGRYGRWELDHLADPNLLFVNGEQVPYTRPLRDGDLIEPAASGLALRFREAVDTLGTR